MSARRRRPANPRPYLSPWCRIVREPRQKYETPTALRCDRQFTSPDVVYSFLNQRASREENEVFFVLLLDRTNRLLACHEVSRGTADATSALPRDVFRLAIAFNAPAVILAHNHPSGDHNPSPEDISTTRDLVKAGELLGITVHDHVILGRDGFSSLKEHGAMR